MTGLDSMNITFFENIFYWLWKTSPKLKKGKESSPLMFASGLLMFLCIINVGYIIILLSAILKKNILGLLVEEGNARFIFAIVGFVVVLGIEKICERLYEKKHDLIVRKFQELDNKTIRKKKTVFIVYVIVSLGIYLTTPSLTAMYS